MIKLKYMFENYELAKLALKNWKHDEEQLISYLKYFRISSNAVYPFPANGKLHFLRLSPKTEKQVQNLKGELEFLQYLKSCGYPALTPVASKTGNMLLELDSQWGTYYASVFKGVPGKAVEDTDYHSKVMTAYGKALGRLHRLAMEYEPGCRKWSYKEVLTWIKDVFETYHAPEIMRYECICVERELDLLKCNRENFGLVHYDFEPDNVFFDEAEGCCYAIDFEDGMYHFYLVDILRVFEALSEELGDTELFHAKRYFLMGYQSEKSLEKDYEEKLPLMSRFCNLYSYAGLIRSIAEEVPQEPLWMKHMRHKLEMKISDLERKVKLQTMDEIR